MNIFDGYEDKTPEELANELEISDFAVVENAGKESIQILNSHSITDTKNWINNKASFYPSPNYTHPMYSGAIWTKNYKHSKLEEGMNVLMMEVGRITAIERINFYINVAWESGLNNQFFLKNSVSPELLDWTIQIFTKWENTEIPYTDIDKLKLNMDVYKFTLWKIQHIWNETETIGIQYINWEELLFSFKVFKKYHFVDMSVVTLSPDDKLKKGMGIAKKWDDTIYTIYNTITSPTLNTVIAIEIFTKRNIKTTISMEDFINNWKVVKLLT